MISKVFAFPTENNIVLYGHKYYGNLKSLYENLDIKDYSKFFITLDYKNYKKLKNQSIDVLYGLSIKDTIKIIKSKIYVTDHGLHFYKPLLNNDNKLFFSMLTMDYHFKNGTPNLLINGTNIKKYGYFQVFINRFTKMNLVTKKTTYILLVTAVLIKSRNLFVWKTIQKLL